MGNFLHLALSNTRPRMGGFDFFWQVILDQTSIDAPEFTYRQIDGACQPGYADLLKRFLKLLVTAGFVEIARERTSVRDGRLYRLVKRQASTPVIAEDGTIGEKGRKQQQMWNVMRRSHQGFTIEELRLAASTDDVVVGFRTAKEYVRRLVNAGAITVQPNRLKGESRHIYVLKGSANTGPKAPKRYQAELIYDPNTGLVLGDSIAQEVTS